MSCLDQSIAAVKTAEFQAIRARYKLRAFREGTVKTRDCLVYESDARAVSDALTDAGFVFTLNDCGYKASRLHVSARQ